MSSWQSSLCTLLLKPGSRKRSYTPHADCLICFHHHPGHRGHPLVHLLVLRAGYFCRPNNHSFNRLHLIKRMSPLSRELFLAHIAIRKQLNVYRELLRETIMSSLVIMSKPCFLLTLMEAIERICSECRAAWNSMPEGCSNQRDSL